MCYAVARNPGWLQGVAMRLLLGYRVGCSGLLPMRVAGSPGWLLLGCYGTRLVATGCLGYQVWLLRCCLRSAKVPGVVC